MRQRDLDRWLQARQETCRSKERFRTYAEADEAAYRRRMEFGKTFRPYYCDDLCRQWHLTSD